MKKSQLLTLFVAVLAVVFGAASAQAAKVDVCHIPPGNPDNWHTISVSENALQAHLNHGDLEGSCLANCETLCDDGDACTQDVESDPDQCICLVTPEPVDCDDGNPCTADSCDSAVGACVYDTSLPDGDACDDGDPDTTGEVCVNGKCEWDNGCPCWTEAEIGEVADVNAACTRIGTNIVIQGSDAITGAAENASSRTLLFRPRECSFNYVGPEGSISRRIVVSSEVEANCRASILNECDDRGL